MTGAGYGTKTLGYDRAENFIVVVNVSNEDFEREVGGHVSTRMAKPDSRKASMVKLVDDFVAQVSGADHVANVDGVEAGRDVFLDIFNKFHVPAGDTGRQEVILETLQNWRRVTLEELKEENDVLVCLCRGVTCPVCNRKFGPPVLGSYLFPSNQLRAAGRASHQRGIQGPPMFI